MTQRTLKNKQFNIHRTGVKINEKKIMCKWPLWKIQFGQLDENKIVHTCVCVCVCLNVNRAC